MEGFKSSQKMQCFKEGGAVKYKSRHSEKSEVSEDIAKDKKVVKKAFAIHDKQSHEGDKTNLSKLKKGGRMKKEGGCVGRYKDGGTIKTKVAKTKKAKAPSKAAIKPAMSNIAEPAPAMSPAMSPDMGMMPPPMMKKGGALKKCAEGGSLKSVDTEENPGLAKLPTNVRNKMGYAKKGGLAKKYNEGGRALYDEALQTRSKTGKAGVEAAKESTLGKPSTPEQKEMIKKESIKLGTLDFPHSRKTSREFSEMKKGGNVKKYADGGIVDNIKSVGKKAYENVMGTEAQNKAAAEQEKRIAEKDPSSYEAKYRKLTGKKEGGKACQ